MLYFRKVFPVALACENGHSGPSENRYISPSASGSVQFSSSATEPTLSQTFVEEICINRFLSLAYKALMGLAGRRSSWSNPQRGPDVPVSRKWMAPGVFRSKGRPRHSPRSWGITEVRHSTAPVPSSGIMDTEWQEGTAWHLRRHRPNGRKKEETMERNLQYPKPCVAGQKDDSLSNGEK